MSPRAVRWLVAAFVFAASPAFAQVRPAVFLHGFGAEASDWADTAERLRRMVALEPHIPGLAWRQLYEDQARDLQARQEYRNLPTNTVAVGHSNGGLVAREWSKSHRLGAIVTIGTPHQGAPLMSRLSSWANFTGATPAVLNNVVESFSIQSDWTWVYAEVEGFLKWLSSFSIWSVVNLYATLGVQQAMPVSAQMIPQSLFLAQINSGQNLAREASEIPNRVGIASVAHNYFYAGPARAILPEHADLIATSLYASAFGLLAWADYIFFEASPMDASAFQQMTSLMNAAGFLLSIDPTYCRLVSRYDMSECVPNDGLVPIDSQAYPGAPNILIGTENDGPAHTQEKQRSDDALFLALTTFAHVPVKGSETVPAPPPAPPQPPAPVPPPPPPAPAPEPAPEPTSSRGPVEITNGLLFANQLLWPGDVVSSTLGRRHLSYQGDGNLVIYDEHWIPLWASDTPGTRAGVVAMQSDGNLVIYDPDGVPLWASDTPGHPGAYLAVQNDGNVVIYQPDGIPLWATDTF